MSHIVNFYTAHLVLADPDLVGTLLDGLLWFASNSLLDAACAVKICTEGFFSNLNIQSLRKSDRQIAHKILLSLLLNEQTRTGLVGMKLEFIRGFIISIESEKDPQCLLSVFAMHPILIKHFDFGALAEEHFDCMAAYFPVDYIPVSLIFSFFVLFNVGDLHLSYSLQGILLVSCELISSVASTPLSSPLDTSTEISCCRY